ncbi:hypothetical protein L873DRAFT_1683845 [Choiromyces venosus 120613-1]|uniref:LITAF domain-containing protein n=1 Tax=Choiromyces venosus 120613-1 TaxID=1336337 RepID=A0A3N4JTG6_9PEZI|nr:hypothetical protein L873DRAFT_1683845 [Choiromyces venosus 120613-1]
MTDYKTPPTNTTNNYVPPPAFSEIQPQPAQQYPAPTNPEKPPLPQTDSQYQQTQPPQQPQQPVAGGGAAAAGTYAQATPLAALTRSPAPVDCPVCGKRGLSVVTYETGNTTHLAALLLCIVACLGCIPYLITGLKDVAHSCGNCGTMLAIWHRSGTPGGAEVLVYAQAPAPPVAAELGAQTAGVKQN